jgi:hypothetical protein
MSKAARRPAPALPTGHGDVAASLVLIFPVLLAYEIGVLFCGTVNGADVVTRALYAILGGRTGYLALHAGLALAFLVWIRRARAGGTLRLEVVAPVVLESACYAFALGALIRLVLDRLLGLGAGDTVISALGAGVHEELVFRLGLLSALVAVIGRGRAALPAALALSALAFAGAHHLGGHGEPFTLHAFAFRALAGAAFGAIYWYRSLAHAVYAHVLYDLAVTLVA